MRGLADALVNYFFLSVPKLYKSVGTFQDGIKQIGLTFRVILYVQPLKICFSSRGEQKCFFRYFSCIVQYLAFLVTVLSATRLLSCGCPDISSCMFFLLELYTVSQKNCAFLFLS